MDTNKLALVKTHAASLELNEFQLGTVVAHEETWGVFLGCQSKEEVIEKIIFPINLRKLDKKIIDRINVDKQHSVMNAAGEISYSIGLSVLCKRSHELVVEESQVSAGIINEIVLAYPDGDYPAIPFMLEEYTVQSVGQDLRVKIVQAPDTERFIKDNFANIARWTGVNPKEILLVVVGDLNNILPGEPGYDVDFKQFPNYLTFH